MKYAMLLVAVLACAGCATPAGRPTRNAASAPEVTQAEPRYEHQLYPDYNEGTTWFLRLVEVGD